MRFITYYAIKKIFRTKDVFHCFRFNHFLFVVFFLEVQIFIKNFFKDLRFFFTDFEFRLYKSFILEVFIQDLIVSRFVNCQKQNTINLKIIKIEIFDLALKLVHIIKKRLMNNVKEMKWFLKMRSTTEIIINFKIKKNFEFLISNICRDVENNY